MPKETPSYSVVGTTHTVAGKVGHYNRWRGWGRKARSVWDLLIRCCTHDVANDISADHFFQQLPHQDAAPAHHYLVQDFPLTSTDLERLLQCQVHEHIHTNHDALNLTTTVQLDP